MARYKNPDKDQGIMPYVFLSDQLHAGTLEYAINELFDNRVDLSDFDVEIKNDKTGAPAYPPKVLLKAILFGYSRGMTTSRKLEWSCKSNLVFMALTGGLTPDHSTFAAFISKMGKKVEKVFAEVLLICHECKLLESTHFSLDGVKLPSNASKECAGKIDTLKAKQEKLRERIKKKLADHKQGDISDDGAGSDKSVDKFHKEIDRIANFLENNKAKKGRSGQEIQSNVTDNESSKMHTSQGIQQGYNAQALVNEQQLIVAADISDSGGDHDVLSSVMNKAKENLDKVGLEQDYFNGKILTADNNYHTQENLETAKTLGLDAYIPDNKFRVRDKKMGGRESHKPKKKNLFGIDDFKYNKEDDTYICPKGKVLRLYERNAKKNKRSYRRYSTIAGTCKDCPLRSQCLRNKNQKSRFVSICTKVDRDLRDEMIDKIDSPEGKKVYSKRMGIVEPVFGNIRYCKGMNRFTLRSKKKVSIQWTLYCLVHNIEKLRNSFSAA